MSNILRVELLSPLTPGSGLGRAGVVDRDVVNDQQTGLPWIPGRRLKGLLRDHYGQIAALGVLPNLPKPGDLFGYGGSRDAALLELGNATLPNHEAMAQDLRIFTASEKRLFGPEEVLDQYTEIRRQTRISRETGSAQPETLRGSRALKSGLVFEAVIGNLPEPALQGIALAAAAVHWMGSSRHRGYGEVKMSVWSDGANITEDLLRRLAAGDDFTPFQPTAGFGPVPVTAPGTPSQNERYELVFDVELAEPAALPAMAKGDPNTVETYDYIPGTVVHGLLARKHLARHGADADFSRLYFTSPSGVLATAAQPLYRDGNEWRETLPVPNSIRTDKHNPRNRLDLARFDPDETFEPERIKERRYVSGTWQGGGPSPKVAVHTQMQYHHQRAHDNRIQRALGSEPKDLEPYAELSRGEQGALFVYESLNSGQRFRGRIFGSNNDLDRVRSLLDDRESIRIGRSRHTQYGAAVWHWGEQRKYEPVEEEETESNKSVVICLLTPLIGTNESGQPAAVLPIDEMKGVDGIQKAFTRREWIGGYLGHQNLPRQQTPALSAGSTFRLKVNEFNPAEFVSRSYGLRTEEGFGRIEIRLPDLPEQLFEEITTSAIPGQAARGLATKILRSRVEQSARRHYREHTLERIKKCRLHLLYRMIRALEHPDGLDRLVRLIRDARRTAQRQLEGVRVGSQTLGEFLTLYAQQWEDQFGRIVNSAVKNEDQQAWHDALGGAPLAVLKQEPDFADFARKVVRGALVRFLSDLARERKKESD